MIESNIYLEMILHTNLDLTFLFDQNFPREGVKFSVSMGKNLL